MAFVLALYSLTFVLGAYMGLRYARGRGVRAVLGYGHGLCGIAATVALFLAIRGQPTAMLINDALFFFALVIIAGLFMAVMRFRRIRPPILYWAIHGLVAAVAFVLLIKGM